MRESSLLPREEWKQVLRRWTEIPALRRFAAFSAFESLFWSMVLEPPRPFMNWRDLQVGAQAADGLARYGSGKGTHPGLSGSVCSQEATDRYSRDMTVTGRTGLSASYGREPRPMKTAGRAWRRRSRTMLTSEIRCIEERLV